MTREEKLALASLLREAAESIDEWAPDSGDPDLDDEVERLDNLVQKLNDNAEYYERYAEAMTMEGGSHV